LIRRGHLTPGLLFHKRGQAFQLGTSGQTTDS
jgi:hypothetical protein